MLRYLLISVLMMAFSNAVFSQAKDCTVFTDGKFKITDAAAGGVTYIDRKGDYQVETQESSGIKIRFKVVWLNNCTYTLQIDRFLQNDRDMPFNKDMIITVKILEVYKDSYLQESTSNLYTIKYTSTVVAIK